MWVQDTDGNDCGSLEREPDGVNFHHTPNTSGMDGGSNSRRALAKRQANWPTPDANMGARGTQPEWKPVRDSGHTATYTINQAVRDMYPTPTAHLAKETGAASEYDRNEPTLSSRMFESPEQRNGMALNPDWVEWLMGWPVGMTSLKPLSKEIFDDWKKKSQLGWSKGNAKNVRLDGMPGMQSNGVAPAASCGQEQVEHIAGKHNDSLSGLSPCRAYESRGLGRGECEASDLQDMQYGISAEAFAPSESMQQGMPFRNGAYFGNEAVGLWGIDPADTGEVPRVTDVKENRANRLKAIGNGQVAQCVVKAWELLA